MPILLQRRSCGLRWSASTRYRRAAAVSPAYSLGHLDLIYGRAAQALRITPAGSFSRRPVLDAPGFPWQVSWLMISRLLSKLSRATIELDGANAIKRDEMHTAVRSKHREGKTAARANRRRLNRGRHILKDPENPPEVDSLVERKVVMLEGENAGIFPTRSGTRRHDVACTCRS
jgi:hypothetical protein